MMNRCRTDCLVDDVGNWRRNPLPSWSGRRQSSKQQSKLHMPFLCPSVCEAHAIHDSMPIVQTSKKHLRRLTIHQLDRNSFLIGFFLIINFALKATFHFFNFLLCCLLVLNNVIIFPLYSRQVSFSVLFTITFFEKKRVNDLKV